MQDSIIEVDRLSKRYDLGQIGTTTLKDSLKRGWHRLRGRDPDAEMGTLREASHGSPAVGAPADGRPARDIWALRDVSFRVNKGEAIGIIGRNGAGKSTLLKILTRITDPTSGRAVLRGRVASLLEVGTGFHPDLTGRENTYLNGAILGMKRGEIDRKFDEIVAFAEVEKFIDTPVKRYSSGMYVRLAFAVAAHLEPEILLVDEVLAVGDLAFQRKCLGKMDAVTRAGRTVLFVSHNMATIQALCGRAILLQGGRVVCDGDVTETTSAYLASVRSQGAEQSVEARDDRQGGDLFRFCRVTFRDAASARPLDTIVSGRSVVVDVEYRCPPSVTLQEVVVAIAFSGSGGGFLSACRSDAVGRTFTVTGRGTLRCVLPRFPFSQGRFTFGLIAYHRGTVIDWVKEAGVVDVLAGDYYGTGKIPAAAAQSVFIDYAWEPVSGNGAATA